LKASGNFVIENNAVRIVQTKHRIKVINVKKRKNKRQILRNVLVTMALCAMLVFCCTSIVQTCNQKLFVKQNICRLNSQIDQLEKEKRDLLNENDQAKLNYGDVYAFAKEKLGMSFPGSNQVYYYKNQKGTMIRAN
jgi:cell division protein FtsL